MTLPKRVRQLAPVVVLAAAVLALGACGGQYPNSTFNHHTDLNTWTDSLWNKLLFWGTIVFVIVEGILIYTVIRFRKRPNSPPPQMTHGNTALELTWTVLPVVILIIIAIPTVSTIFKTQAKAPENSLEVTVIGHQWWWEFQYPQYKFTTANELYLPAGKTVNFSLQTKDVIHSFWVPQLGGKRDVVSNRVNHIWYTPAADIADSVWNGFCTEYCGTSHANMRIHAYVVTPAEFDNWVAGQKAPAITLAPPPATTPTPAPGAPPAKAPPGKGGTSKGAAMASLSPSVDRIAASAAGTIEQGNAAAQTNAQQPAAAPAPTGWYFPAEKLPEYVKPKTPIPAGITYDDNLLANGDAARGEALVAKSGCGSCHMITPGMFPTIGPNLSHVGSRHTIAGGIYPNDPPHLARWIKNAKVMKPGALMYVFGVNENDPPGTLPGNHSVKGMSKNLTDAEIADVVAYLQKLK
ncbi:MAG TPA: cytochrome c oxidase subunit II [Gemmatimonadaceae bacterium]|nr:cytochrome c oxidase subunit II [Gemmatimonadaceae bacterium]